MPDQSYLEQLNEAQRAAVEYIDGPELVIAGAGSGKTRVLTYKIVHLLANGYRPNRILALTFTNKAADEMRQRIQTLVGAEVASRLWMGTFHSIFARLLRINADRIGFPANFTIYDSADSKSLIKSIIKELGLDDKYYRPTSVLADISHAKNNLYSPADYAADRAIAEADRAARRPEMARIFAIYTERCRIAGAMDFDDLLYYTNVLLRDNPDVLEHYRNYFAYILVDEYQDTNFAQHLIVRQLASTSNRLCVVGDDAQSIYSFRGANIRNILDLKKTFPTLRTYKLEENYRSTKNIVGAANSLIAANVEQLPKEAYSNKADGDRIDVLQCYNDFEEAYMVASRIQQQRMRSHTPLNDMAVLYRTNAQSRALEEALRNRNIPYRVYGGLAFYQRKEVKDAVSYFRLATNPADDEALRRVINTPRRGIGDTTVQKVLAAAMAAGVSMYDVLNDPARFGLNVNRGTAAKLTEFTAMIQRFAGAASSGMDAAELARRIIEDTGLMAQYLHEHTPENISKRENLQELVKGVDQFVTNTRESQGEQGTGMADFLSTVSLLSDRDTEVDDGDDCVTLMTIHSAKGLEYDCVFIVGVEEDLLPSAMSRGDAMQIEEERRLLYVAITRAKRFCTMSYTGRRMVNGQTQQTHPSRFLQNIDRRYLRMMTGSRIEGPADSGFRPRASAPAPWDTPAPAAPRRPSASVDMRPPTPRPPVAGSAAPPRQAAAGSMVSGEFTVHSAAELGEGMRIAHPNFGLGVIRQVDTSRTDARIVVEFSADGSRRTLLLKFAKFKVL